jgi:glycosyltransferase involved in cell wall biosynthesis
MVIDRRQNENISTSSMLLCDLAPYVHSTRTKKVGSSVSLSVGNVRAVTLSRVGRLGMADDRRKFTDNGVDVEQIPVRELEGSRTLTASLRNLIVAYIPAIWKLYRVVINTPAHTVFVGHNSLFWLGLMHQKRWRSHVILNGRERPGGVRTSGSLASWFSRVEPMLLKWVARKQPTVLSVCNSHASSFRALGFEDVIVARNVPSSTFASDFVAPDGKELTVACVGSLYPGRGIEALVDGVVIARNSGARVKLEITGPAGAEYADKIRRRIRLAGAERFIRLNAPCRPDEVAACYQAAHIGTALYEPVDAANDSLSNKLFECVVSGRPVLAGDLTENREVVQKHDVGWVVSVVPEAIGELLISISSDIDSIERRAMHCYATGRRNFTWEAEIAGLVSLVERWADAAVTRPL